MGYRTTLIDDRVGVCDRDRVFRDKHRISRRQKIGRSLYKAAVGNGHGSKRGNRHARAQRG